MLSLSCCCCSCCIFIVPFLGFFFFFFVHNGVNFAIVDKCLETLLPSLHSFWPPGISVHIDVIEGKLDSPSPFLIQKRDRHLYFVICLLFFIEVPRFWISCWHEQVVLVAENVLPLKIHKLGSKVHSSVSVKIQWRVQCSMNASEFIHLGSGSAAMLYYVSRRKELLWKPLLHHSSCKITPNTQNCSYWGCSFQLLLLSSAGWNVFRVPVLLYGLAISLNI